jgi:hypothetical protein
MKTLFVFITLHLIYLSCSIAQGQDTLYNSKLFSPDRSKSVIVKISGRDVNYEFTDEHNGKKVDFPALSNPVFAIIWSLDSNYLFSAIHVARGCDLQIIHVGPHCEDLTDVPFDVYPGQYYDYYVLDWNIRPKSLELIFDLALCRANGQSYSFYRCVCDVNPVTGKASNMIKTPINYNSYSNLKSKFFH